MADERTELMELRRLAELEAKAAPEPSLGEVALNAIAKGGMNLLNLPASVANVAMKGLTPPFLREQAPEIPNLPMKAAEAIGAVNPDLNPQSAGGRIIEAGVQAGTQTGLIGGPAGAAVGFLSGTLAQVVKEATGSDLLALATGVVTPFALRSMQSTARSPVQTPVRDQTLKDAQAAGYVVQPSTVKPSFTTNRLESVAGKAAVAQDASVRNQVVTNKLAAKSIGLPEETPLNMTAIEQVRATAAKPYQEVEALRPTLKMAWFPRFHSPNLLDELKQARADKTTLFRSYDRTADPAILKQAKAASTLAESIERDIEAIAQAAGRPELVGQLKAARELYARTYDVERALNLGDGNISAPILGRMLDQGRPLSGELATVGRFAQAFPRVAREGASLPPPTVSGVDAASSAVLGTAGFAAGGPGGLIAAGLPLLRGPARNLVLSKGYQSSLLKQPPSLATAATRSALVGRSLLEMESD